jgi:predicted PurR-regulated permease PerM
MHEYFPLPEGKYKKIKARLEDIFRGVVVGQVAVAIIQGLLAWIAFYFLGVPHAFLWSFMTIIISSIPMLGAAMIWIPIDIYLAVIGQQTGNYLPAIILFLYGWFFISTIDNFLRPKIMGDNAKVHPVLFLLGILGGIPLFGVAGILIGPAVLALSTIAIEIYRESF